MILQVDIAVSEHVKNRHAHPYNVQRARSGHSLLKSNPAM